MRILVIGNGGREHALLWKLKRDLPDAELFVTRGNGGTAALATSIPLDPADSAALAGWAQARNIELTIVGPDAPLAEGIVDHFSRSGLAIFGPTRAAAAIESSKAFAKALMKEAGVPTAAFESFTDLAAAESYIRERGAPIVVKASGLALGKGAVVCNTVEDAVAALGQMMSGAFGEAGREVVIEEFMEGEELSLLALTDGERALPLVPAQDYKRVGEGDTGPNTGGMGAYAPVTLATPELLARVQKDIFTPTLAAMRAQRKPFRGLLYAGLMITKSGPRVVEFNARFGDPETQVVLPLLQSSLLTPLLAIARGDSLEGITLENAPGAALTTVLAAAGYPGTPDKGKPISIPQSVLQDENVIVFHAGTKLENDAVVTAGGRVLAVTGVGSTLEEAAARSRSAAEAISFEGKQYRRDIGWRELARVAGQTPHA